MICACWTAPPTSKSGRTEGCVVQCCLICMDYGDASNPGYEPELKCHNSPFHLWSWCPMGTRAVSGRANHSLSERDISNVGKMFPGRKSPNQISTKHSYANLQPPNRLIMFSTFSLWCVTLTASRASFHMIVSKYEYFSHPKAWPPSQ